MAINKKFLFIFASAVIILILVLLFISIKQTPHQNTIQSMNGKYLNFSNGSLSNIFLIDSSARYGVYERNLTPHPDIMVFKGDPCIIINATIRNDYNKDYWIDVTAQLFNKSGGKVGLVTQLFAPWKPFEQIYARSNVTRNVELYIKYDKEDVTSYNIYVYEKLFDEPSP